MANASPRQCNNGDIPGSVVFYTVRRQADSDATMEHVTLRLRVTARSVFYADRPETV
jgi:hypothetical protein